MTWEELGNIIRSRFDSQVADVQSLQTQYDNQSFDNPDNELWCRLTINFGQTFQVDCGGGSGSRDRTIGVMTAQLFLAVDQGDKQLLETADKIKTAFNRVTDTGVHFRTPSIKRVGRVNNEWQVNVNCPFYADDIS